ncbi:MAG: class I SAM-dependent methyltransferase [Cyclobacteriaceae bacterium]
MDVIGQYYKSADYISHTNNTRNLSDLVYKIVRWYMLNQKSKLIKKHHSVGSILDYGCGTGHFLKHMQNKGWQVSGIEPDQSTNIKASDKTKVKINTTLSELSRQQEFDIITAWHVIEHVHDLQQTIKGLRNKLSESGFMFIALPNHNSYDAMHYKEHWAAYDVPRHLYHFSQDSFMRLIKSQKLHLIDTVPMPFDSYYVSLLSEKNSTGKTNYLEAFKTGRKSNATAKNKTSEYSSLIYVLSK